MTNPFAPATPTQQPAAPAQAPAPSGNPFGAPAPAHQQAAPPAPAQQAPAYAPPAQQPQAQPYGDPSRQGGSPWPAGAVPAFGTPPPPTPTQGKGDPAPTLIEIWGRGVLIFPLAIRHGVTKRFTDDNDRPKVVSQLTCKIVVLWDPRGVNYLEWGGDPSKPPFKPHPNRDPFPFAYTPTWPIEQGKIIEQCTPFMPGGQLHAQGQNCALGIIGKGAAPNDPWHLQPANDEVTARAMYYIEGVRSGQFPDPLA